jgi:1-acyl-sn-glycerol-3-phosphate acyltransferase
VGRALVFFLVQAPLALLLTVACASASCLAALGDRSGGTTRLTARAWSRALLRLLGVDVSVSGREHAPAGPAVYAANHASVVVFPEGTRSPDGAVRRFKRGSFRLAHEAGVPVVPVSLAGVKAVVPRGLASVRPGLVRVVLHPVVPVAGRSAEEAEALAEEVRRIVAAGCRAAGEETA